MIKNTWLNRLKNSNKNLALSKTIAHFRENQNGNIGEYTMTLKQTFWGDIKTQLLPMPTNYWKTLMMNLKYNCLYLWIEQTAVTTKSLLLLANLQKDILSIGVNLDYCTFIS